MNSEIIHQLIEAINQHKIAAVLEHFELDSLLSDAGKTYRGIKEQEKYWMQLFTHYPNYSLLLENQIHHGKTIAVFTAVALDKPINSNHQESFSLAWKIQLRGSKISSFELFKDRSLPALSPIEEKKEAAITGLGGVFLKSKNPKDLCTWYDQHLGTNFGKNTYHSFKWRERLHPEKIGRTEFSIFTENSSYFAPSEKTFMLNFRVRNLDEFLNRLQVEGVHVLEKRDYTEYGNFGWIMDPDGNKLEIWEAVDQVLEDFDANALQ